MTSNALPVTLILENIRSLYNVGSIFRTADGVGLEKIVLLGITPYPAHEGDARKPWEQHTVTNKLNKTALGAQNTVAWEYVESIDTLSTQLPIISLEKTDTSVSLFDIDLTFPFTLVVGNEVDGVSPEMLGKSDVVVHLPMHGKKESLNVASATAIALYELRRKYEQRVQ